MHGIKKYKGQLYSMAAYSKWKEKAVMAAFMVDLLKKNVYTVYIIKHTILPKVVGHLPLHAHKL